MPPIVQYLLSDLRLSEVQSPQQWDQRDELRASLIIQLIESGNNLEEVFSELQAFLQTNSEFTPNGDSAFLFDPADFSNGQQIVFDSASQNFIPASLITTITLTLSNDLEVEGINYNSIQDAYNYALTVLNVGGHLIINVANETISNSGDIDLDLDRLKISIIGQNQTTSRLSGTGSLIFRNSGNRAILENIRCTKANGILFENAYSGAMTNVTSEAGGSNGPFRLSGSQNFRGTSVTLIGQSGALNIDNSQGVFIAANVEVETAGIDKSAINVTDKSEIYFQTLDFTFPSFDSGTNTGITADNNSQVLVRDPTFNGEVNIQYAPLADTYGNFYSRIITTQ